MVLARAVTHALVGLEPRKVEVEAHLQPRHPGFAIVGLADRACQEAKHRVRSGVVSAALEWPVNRRITVNLAPAALRKEGSGFDLPISLAVLGATRQLPPERLAEHAAVGELALDGTHPARLRHARRRRGSAPRGTAIVSCALPSRRPRRLSPGSSRSPFGISPRSSSTSADDIDAPAFEPIDERAIENGAVPDLADLRGQERARRALEIAAAGSHNLLLDGPPGNREDDARPAAAGHPPAARRARRRSR